MRTAPAPNSTGSTNFPAAAGAPNQPVTFFGEGAEFWSEPAAASHPAEAASVTPQQHGGFHPAPIATPRPMPMPRTPMGAPASTLPAPMRPMHIIFPSASARPASFPRQPNPRRPVFISTPYFPPYPVFGGFGFGGFWGFGYGGLGWFGLDWGPAFDYGYDSGMNCAPFWFEGCDAFYTGYDPYASCCSEPVDPNIGVQPPDEDAGDTGTNRWVPPPDETTPAAQAAAEATEINAEKSLTVLYLTDGSVYAVTNFWVDNGKLTYETSYGAENSIPLSQLDLEATVKANTARGVTFTMRPKPSATPAPGTTPQPQPQAQPQQPPVTPQIQ